MRLLKILFLSCLLLAALVAVACGGGSVSTPAPTPELTPTLVPTPAATPTALPPGASLENPHAAGDLLIGSNGLQVQVVGVMQDAQPFILQNFPDNPAPPLGYRYYMVALRIFNLTGAESFNVSHTHFHLVGSSRSDFNPVKHSCGPIPDQLEGEMLKGGQLEGKVCFQVPVDEDDLVLIYADPGSTSGERRYLSLDYPGVTEPPIAAAVLTPTPTAEPTNPNSNGNAHAALDSHGHPDSHPHPNANPYPHTDASAHACSNPATYSAPHTDSYTHAHSYPDSNTNPHPRTDPRTNADHQRHD